MVFLQHAAKLGRDALGDENGYAGADADEFDVWDGAQTGEERVELGIGEEQGIATGEEHVTHLGVAFQITENGIEFRVQLLLSHTGNHATACAVAAVAGAAVGDEEEHAVWIAMHQAWHGHVAVFAAGIGHFIGIVPGFFYAWDDLTADGALRVVGVDEVEIMRCDGHRQFAAGEQDACAFFIGELEAFFE